MKGDAVSGQKALIEALRNSGDRPMTPELARQQKISGIMAGLPMDSTITRESIEAYVRGREGGLDEQ